MTREAPTWKTTSVQEIAAERKRILALVAEMREKLLHSCPCELCEEIRKEIKGLTLAIKKGKEKL